MALAGSDSRWLRHLVEEWLVTVHNHGTEEGRGLSCRESMVNGELKGECMSDSLRDRIAKAIYLEANNWGGPNWETISPKVKPAYMAQADAVIAVISDEYVNSRGMFHEPDRCMAGNGCKEGCSD
jgi:hypothetical protein